jgi:hypothetical protein
MFVQRSIAIARAKKLLAAGASIDHVLGGVWNAGFIEGGDEDSLLFAPDDSSEFDRRVEEMNRAMEAGL